jgi:hypothetical protein
MVLSRILCVFFCPCCLSCKSYTARFIYYNYNNPINLSSFILSVQCNIPCLMLWKCLIQIFAPTKAILSDVLIIFTVPSTAARIVAQIKPQSLHSTPIPIHYLLISIVSQEIGHILPIPVSAPSKCGSAAAR